VDAIRICLKRRYRLKAKFHFGKLKNKYGFYLIPEGGTNELAIKAVRKSNQRDEQFNYICCPVGTGGTISEY
jgi:1-aminocyclopropane-1-carboxylate deaminase